MSKERYRTGTIYKEKYNKGAYIYSIRFVAEISISGQRHRFRSTNYGSAKSWLDMMIRKHPTY